MKSESEGVQPMQPQNPVKRYEKTLMWELTEFCGFTGFAVSLPVVVGK